MSEKFSPLVQALLLFLVCLVGGFFILQGYLSGELIGIGRHNHESYSLSDDHSRYWYNMVGWFGLVLFCFGAGVRQLWVFIKRINDSDS